MGERFKEFACFVVDVGPHTHDVLPLVEDFLVCSVEGKILNRPIHEVALLLFGTTGTLNEPHQEAAQGGDDTQFLHITVAQNYCQPAMETLATCAKLPRGKGYSDVLDTLAVYLDMTIKCEKDRLISKAPRRCILISTFKGKGKGWDGDFQQHIVQTFSGRGLKLEVLHLDLPTAGGAADPGPGTVGASTSNSLPPAAQPTPGATSAETTQAAVDDNIAGLTAVLEALGVEPIQRIRSRAQLSSALRWLEVQPTSILRGNLHVGNTLRVPVRVYKKTSREAPPSLTECVIGPSGEPQVVRRDTEYHVAGSPDEVVQENDIVKGYRYGGDYIPIPDATESMMKFACTDKGIWLWGFTPASQIKRFAYMSEALVVVPEYEAPGAAAAVSALVRAMADAQEVAVARYVARTNSKPQLLVLAPWLGTARRPDAWVANVLPFEQDVKWVDFPPLGRGAALQSEQVAATDMLVDSMMFGGAGGPRSLLQPETTPNPSLCRFYRAAAARALRNSPSDEAPAVPGHDEDDLVASVFTPPAPAVEASQAARQRIAELFPLMDVEPEAAEQAPEGAVVVGEGVVGPDGVQPAPADADAALVGTTRPVEDFTAAIQRPDKVKDAMWAMRAVVVKLVDNSLGDRWHLKAQECVQALREAAVRLGMPAAFNEHLRGLATRYRAQAQHSVFWARLLDAGVRPIQGSEVPDASEGAMTAEEAAAFLHANRPLPQAGAPEADEAAPFAAEAEAAEAGAFEDME